MLKRLLTRFNIQLVLGVGLLSLAIIMGIRGHQVQYNIEGVDWNILFEDFYANASSELISIAITILIIDNLNLYRETKREKASLIREMSSLDNGIALRATEELRGNGWLFNGSLREANLTRANLEEADLRKADLQGADFR